MKRWKMIAGITVLTLGLSLTGCGSKEEVSGDAVAVQSVSMLAGLGNVGLQNRYAGVVVAQATHDIQKDGERRVEELKVAVGDEVKAGQILFTYDMDEIQMSIAGGELELEKMQNSIETNKKQIAQLEKDKKKAGSSEQLSYTIQIQTLEADIKETEYNINTKKLEQERLKKTMENSEVRSEVNGVVQSINEDDNGGNMGYYDDGQGSNAYITIVETGTYRVKGLINEMNMSDIGMLEGQPVLIRSRVDASVVWRGTMGSVDMENPEKNNNNYYYSDSDETTSSSRYPFYVELDDSQGLMMGQHVFIELDQGQDEKKDGIWIASYYLDPENQSYVWAANDKDRLEKREIKVGEYNEELDTYEILSGLTAEDYIAIPSEDLKAGLPVVRYDEAYFDAGSYEDYGDGEYYEEGEFQEGEFVEGEFAEGEFQEGEFAEGEFPEGPVAESEEE